MRILLRAVAVFLFLDFSTMAEAGELRVFAAASLKNAIDEINVRWKTASGHEASGVFAASPVLAKQIAEGAPADIFISADLAWMDELEKKDLIDKASRRNLLGNTLVLIAPAGSGLKIDLEQGVDLLAALGGGRLAIGETKAVPAGRYAKAALERLGIWDALKDHLAEQVNVRAALLLVYRGEAPLGVVYGSDAVAESSIEVVATFSPSLHPPIVYPVARVAASHNGLAAGYLNFLFAPEASEAFIRNGFTVPK